MKRMNKCKLVNFDDYEQIIKKDSVEATALIESLNVPNSSFFRNICDYAILEHYILPELLIPKSNDERSFKRFWSCGCATGQEAYSLAILTHDLKQMVPESNLPVIIATDISQSALSIAEKGIYSPASLYNLKSSHIQNYFAKLAGFYLLNAKIQNSVEFSHNNMLEPDTSLPPSGIYGGFDLFCCCNLLIYYNEKNQQTIIKKLFNSLNRGGFLLVDESEHTLIEAFGGFQLYSESSNIFIKRYYDEKGTAF
jgi:chemotaxis methyl-accepting protein methylase